MALRNFVIILILKCGNHSGIDTSEPMTVFATTGTWSARKRSRRWRSSTRGIAI